MVTCLTPTGGEASAIGSARCRSALTLSRYAVRVLFKVEQVPGLALEFFLNTLDAAEYAIGEVQLVTSEIDTTDS